MPNKTVGFDRVIRRHDLDHVLEIAHARTDVQTARRKLVRHLEAAIPSTSSRQKTAGILRSIWLDPPAQCITLQEEGLTIDKNLVNGSTDQLALHWGMTIAGYPFVGAVAETVGRLLRLQEAVSISGIRRRIQQAFGDRSTVNKAVPCVLRSFHEWGILRQVTDSQFASAEPLPVPSARLAGWLLEATLHSQGTEADDFQTLLTSAYLFPFILPVRKASELPTSKRRMIQRQGQRRDVLVLS